MPVPVVPPLISLGCPARALVAQATSPGRGTQNRTTVVPIAWLEVPALKMNIFRLAGDMSHVASILILMLRLIGSKQANGAGRRQRALSKQGY